MKMQQSTAFSLVLDWMLNLSNLFLIFRVHRCSHSIGVLCESFFQCALCASITYRIPFKCEFVTRFVIAFFQIIEYRPQLPLFYCHENYFYELYYVFESHSNVFCNCNLFSIILISFK